ncbi:MAG: hypothetical protein LBL74_07555 [Bacteroidales bacterium]|jgi:hypothetical protein|nr:hypothetical protein [Bacteroidales bacterium]
MKILKYAIYLFVIYSFTACEGIEDILHIRNNSDEAIYVYLECGNVDSLPLSPKLELFNFISADMKDAHGNTIEPYFISPDYRINAYSTETLHGGIEGRVFGKPKEPRFPCEENELTLFFITEKTMREYNWEEIYKNQMFTKKVTLTEDELKNLDWKYTYSPL